jgi:hypothetical protein
VRAGYDPFLTGHRVVLSGGRGWTYHLAVGGPIAWPLTGASWTDFEGRTEWSSVEGLTGGPEAPEPASALRYLAHRVTSSQEQRRSPRWSEAVAISTSPQPHA